MAVKQPIQCFMAYLWSLHWSSCMQWCHHSIYVSGESLPNNILQYFHEVCVTTQIKPPHQLWCRRRSSRNQKQKNCGDFFPGFLQKKKNRIFSSCHNISLCTIWNSLSLCLVTLKEQQKRTTVLSMRPHHLSQVAEIGRCITSWNHTKTCPAVVLSPLVCTTGEEDNSGYKMAFRLEKR